MLDAAIVGAGPVGLNDALVRCRGRVLVCDIGRSR